MLRFLCRASNRGVSNRGVSNRGVSNRGVYNRGASDLNLFANISTLCWRPLNTPIMILFVSSCAASWPITRFPNSLYSKDDDINKNIKFIIYT